MTFLNGFIFGWVLGISAGVTMVKLAQMRDKDA